MKAVVTRILARWAAGVRIARGMVLVRHRMQRVQKLCPIVNGGDESGGTSRQR
jgi:hypothetical protein